MLGVAAWHLRRGRNVEVFRGGGEARDHRRGAALRVPALLSGNEFGSQTTDAQPMKIAATEALWDTEQPASFSLFQIGGFTQDDQTPSFSIEIPGLLSYLATTRSTGKVVGLNEIQAQDEQQYGPGQLHPEDQARYW